LNRRGLRGAAAGAVEPGRGAVVAVQLIAIDEVGYVPLAEVGAELLFQVISERAEKAAVILTTNLPFSEWTQVFPNPRLCKALLDRVDGSGAHHRDRRRVLPIPATLEGRQKRKN